MAAEEARLTPHADLIYDVGMHVGKDTAFYLKKGFRVVAVEALPAHVINAEKQFHTAIAEGRLTIVSAAVARTAGRVQFFVNLDKDQWGTTSPEFATRNEKLGTRNELVEVNAVTMQSILECHGIPYYLKIDIEGADTLCLEALHQFSERPRFVSIEIDLNSFTGGFESIVHLWNLGYRDFKIVNQCMNSRVTCPNPPLEGVYTPAKFDAHTSGPFGEETPGHWMSVEETLQRYQKIMRQTRLFGATGKYYHTPLRRLSKWSRRLLGLEPLGWYDLHARYCELPTSSD